ncbi:MAG TPA: hypothetical protein VM694_29525 [Polyangium sp.]|nr:hypothetical protein [Polyangium sp.]
MKWAWGILIVPLLGFGGEASAQPGQPPRACRGAEERGAFEEGRAPGRALARGVADEARCAHLELVAERVLRKARRLRPPRGFRKNRDAACKHAGNVVGVIEELHGIWARCGAACCREGQLIAEITGQLYCDLSIDLGGIDADEFIPRPVQAFCGEAFQTCCDARFSEFTRAYTDDEGQSCKAYTEGEFSSAWEDARGEQCSYD